MNKNQKLINSILERWAQDKIKDLTYINEDGLILRYSNEYRRQTD